MLAIPLAVNKVYVWLKEDGHTKITMKQVNQWSSRNLHYY